MMAERKKRRPIYRHEAWGVSFNGAYDSSLCLKYREESAWAIAAFKYNMMKLVELDRCFAGEKKVPARIKAKLRKKGVGVCRVLVTQQQLDRESTGS